MEASQKAVDAVEKSRNRIKELSDFIHSHPELGYAEKKSSAAVADLLEKNGFSIQRTAGGLETAFIARAVNSGDGPRIAFLAEYDALPKLGHACGHNLIAAASAAASIGVASAYENIPGEISCVGTPAEEGGAGKVVLARNGVFDGLDAVMMTHPSNINVVLKKALGVVSISVKYIGKSAHASAFPEKGINALDAMILFFSGINAIRQHITSHERVHGVITYGGDAANIIPGYTEAAVLVRALDERVLDLLLERVKSIAEGAALSTGCKLDFAPMKDMAYAPFHPNRKLAGLFREKLESLGVEVQDVPEDEGMGSSDIGNVSRVAPTIHPEYSIAGPEIVNHTPEFAEAAGSEKAFDAAIETAKAMALTAISIFERPESATEIRAEFDSRIKGENV